MTRDALSSLLPREHGAWAVVLVPFAVGSIASGIRLSDMALLLVAVLGVFLAQAPFRKLIQDRTRVQTISRRQRETLLTVALVLAGALAAGGILLMRGNWFLLGIAAAGFLAFAGIIGLSRKGGSSLLSDFVSVLGLTLSGPAAYAVGSGMLDETALALWLLLALFFGSGFIYVQMKVRASSMKQVSLTWSQKLRLGKQNLLYHGAAALGIGLLAYSVSLDLIVVAAFVPMLIHAIIGTVRMTSRTKFKRLGFLLVGQSLVFGAMIVAFWP